MILSELQHFKWRATGAAVIGIPMFSHVLGVVFRRLCPVLAGGLLVAPMAAQALTVVPERDIPRMVSFGGACVRCDLSGRQLSGARFLGADFSGSVLIGADLRDASMTGADFSRSDLSRSDLTGANITGADFEGARLREVRLDSAWIRGVSFTGSDLEGASLRGVVFSGVDLSGARNLRQEQLDAACAQGAVKLPRGMVLRACAGGASPR